MTSGFDIVEIDDLILSPNRLSLVVVSTETIIQRTFQATQKTRPVLNSFKIAVRCAHLYIKSTYALFDAKKSRAGWVEVKAGLRISYGNQKYILCFEKKESYNVIFQREKS